VNGNIADERRSARANVLLAGFIEGGGVRIRVRVGNQSAHGALLIGDMIPPRDTQVTFHCNGVTVESWVAWVQAPHAGIQFGEPIQPQDLVRNTAVPIQMITKDTRKLDFRRPGFRGNQLTDEERKIVEESTRPPPVRRGE
jgi:hypothetical protein